MQKLFVSGSITAKSEIWIHVKFHGPTSNFGFEAEQAQDLTPLGWIGIFSLFTPGTVASLKILFLALVQELHSWSMLGPYTSLECHPMWELFAKVLPIFLQKDTHTHLGELHVSGGGGGDGRLSTSKL